MAESTPSATSVGTVSTSHFPRLDGLRGMAALMVAGSHAAMLWAPGGSWGRADALVIGALGYGWTGVVLFFVLSGWLLSLPFWRDGVGDLAEFSRRRIGRVLPLFWFQVALFALLLALSLPMPGLQANAVIGDVGWQALMAFRLTPDAPGAWMSVWWTLPLELSFYLILPLLFLLPLRLRWPSLIALLMLAPLLRATMALGWLGGPWARVLIDQLPARIDLFVIGVIAAGLWVQRGEWLTRLSAPVWRWLGVGGLWSLVLGSVWLGVISPVAVPRSVPLAAWQTLFAGLAACWIIGCCLPAAAASQAGSGFSGSWPMRWLGRLSFSIYLWHFPVFMALRPWMRQLIDQPWQLLPALLLAMLPVLALSYLSWRLIEAPARDWVRHGGRKPAASRAPA